jgi:hypothetical protein
MSFDLTEFSKSKFKTRTMRVPVTSEALCHFFGEDDKKEFTVKGLTGEELGRCENSHSRIKMIKNGLEALLGPGENNVKAIKDLLSLGGDALEDDVARRIELLCLGCVDPELDEQQAAKITKVAPVDAKNLTNHVLILSGQGMLPGGLQASGDAETSGPAVQSDTPEASVSSS